MNSEERAARLMEKAVKLGTDTPTEAAIAEAILDAEEDARTDAEFSTYEQVKRWFPAIAEDLEEKIKKLHA